MTKVVHSLLVDAAKEIAGEAYESIAHDNAFYAEWPNRRVFVRKNWQMFVDSARDQMLTILGGNYPDTMKQPIYEALTIDGSMKRDPTAADPGQRLRLSLN